MINPVDLSAMLNRGPVPEPVQILSREDLKIALKEYRSGTKFKAGDIVAEKIIHGAETMYRPLSDGKVCIFVQYIPLSCSEHGTPTVTDCLVAFLLTTDETDNPPVEFRVVPVDSHRLVKAE